MKYFILNFLLPLLFVAVGIYAFVANNTNVLIGMLVCGVSLLIVGGILWIVKNVKEGKEYNRINEEYDQYEKEAAEIVQPQVEAVKGNSLKKKLVKRRLVREYIEKNHPKASRHVDSSKFEGLYSWMSALGCCGMGLVSPVLLIVAAVVLIIVLAIVFLLSASPFYLLPFSYCVVANAVFATLAVGTLLWKRYYIMALVAGVLAIIYVYGICTVGPNGVLTPAYYWVLYEEGDCFPNLSYASKTMFCSILILMTTSFCMMIYPFFKKCAICLWLFVFVTWMLFPMSTAVIIYKLYIIHSAIVADIAVMIGMPYSKTHMIFFVYMLSLLPVVSALPAFFRTWRACRRQDEKTRANAQYTEKCEHVFRLCMTWLIVNIVAMGLLWSRFIGFPLLDAQLMLENDCETIADFTGIYFEVVYIIVLVVPPLCSIMGSLKLYDYTK